jgi:hypothetical protein
MGRVRHFEAINRPKGAARLSNWMGSVVPANGLRGKEFRFAYF